MADDKNNQPNDGGLAEMKNLLGSIRSAFNKNEDYAKSDEVASVFRIFVAALGEVKNLAEKQFKEAMQAIKTIKLTPGPQGEPGKRGRQGPPGNDGLDADPDEVASALKKDLKFRELIRGKTGLTGPIPKHEWDGKKLRFENPDGSWGPWVSLEGAPGMPGFSMFGGPSGPSGIERILGTNFLREGVSELLFSSDFSLTRSGNGVRVGFNGSVAGANVAGEKVTGVQSGTNVTLDLTTLAHAYTGIFGVSRQGQLLTPNSSWTQAGDTITIPNADASEDFVVQYTY